MFMKELFAEKNITLSPEKEEKFEEYKKILLFYNEKFNLTAITDEKDIENKHFLDSAMGVDKFITSASVAEIGSGAGFPSVPLKILRDDLFFTLIESTGKKCEFLRTVVKELGLKGVTVINGRAEDLGKDGFYREKFDYAVARAVARLNILCEYCMPFVKVGGEFIAYKGSAEEEIKEAVNAVKILGGKYVYEDVYELPENAGKRTLVGIKKISQTPPVYPRGNGKERKKPII